MKTISIENEKHQLEEYRNLVNSDGLVEVQYKKHKNIKYGRVYAERSLGDQFTM
jgi:hypothetical protein